MQVDVKTLEAKSAGKIDLSDAIFGLEPRRDILQRMVVYQLAKRRSGTQMVKNRNEITGTGAKMFRQKGTGRARHGNKKVPQFRGGGKAFGARPRSHAIDLPKKVRALALRHALSAKVKSEELIIIDSAALKDAKTKQLLASFEKLGLKNALIIDGREVDKNFALASKNIVGVDVLPVQGINVYDILRRNKLVLTKAALEELEARFA